MPTYTYTQLKSDINGKIKGKIGILTDIRSTINQGVRQANSEIDMLTARRKTALTPNLFSGISEYAAPTDLKGYGIITIENQKLTKRPDWSLVPYEQFLRRQDNNTIAISDYDFIRKLFIKSSIVDTKTTISSLDSITDDTGGTWSVFGEAENLVENPDDYIEGEGSLEFSINNNVGGTTAGIVNSTLDPIDVSSFLQGSGQATVFAKISSTTGITNFTLRFGTDSSNYYTKTTTSQADGTDFVNGWNILSFDLTSLTETGTVTDTSTGYYVLYMTKATDKISEDGYMFDGLCFRRGEINKVIYYSSYGWQSSAGVCKENSTADSDVLNAGSEEYELILAKCSEIAADEVDEDKVSEKQAKRFKDLSKIYKASNPSESLTMITTTQDFVKI